MLLNTVGYPPVSDSVGSSKQSSNEQCSMALSLWVGEVLHQLASLGYSPAPQTKTRVSSETLSH